MNHIINQYKREVEECNKAINSNQLDKKQLAWYKQVKNEALKRIKFHS